MRADIIAIVGILVFISSLISLRVGLSVAIIEILFGAIAGNSLIAGTALSTTSLAVVYSVLVETGLSKSEIGKLIMASTFITDTCRTIFSSCF